MDIQLHSIKSEVKIDFISRLHQNTHRECLLMDAPLEVNFMTSQTHLINGYDSYFYVYEYATMMADKIYNSKSGIGERYKRLLLQPGASKKGKEMIDSFFS